MRTRRLARSSRTRRAIRAQAALLVVALSACRASAPAVNVVVSRTQVLAAAARPTAPSVAVTRCAAESVQLQSRREAAVQRGIAFMVTYLTPDDRLRAIGTDGAGIFLELALTSRSAAISAPAARIARTFSTRLLARYVAPDGIRDAAEFSDALELLIDAPHTGIPTERLLAVLSSRFRAFANEDAAYGLPLSRAADLNDEQAFNLLLLAYTFERADVSWPGRFSMTFRLEAALRVLWARPLVAWPVDGTSADRSIESAYLATHVALVMTEYGRRPMPRESLGRFGRFLREHLSIYLRVRDVELVSETADVLRQLGERDETHEQLCAATGLLLAAQNNDGSWGDWQRETNPYDAVHKTWAAVTGLVERLPGEDGPFAQRVREVLARLRGT